MRGAKQLAMQLVLVKGGQECWGEAAEERTVVQLANMNVTRGHELSIESCPALESLVFG